MAGYTPLVLLQWPIGSTIAVIVEGDNDNTKGRNLGADRARHFNKIAVSDKEMECTAVHMSTKNDDVDNFVVSSPILLERCYLLLLFWLCALIYQGSVLVKELSYLS